MKKCKKCGEVKPETEFFKKRKTSLEGTCKECKKKRLQERKELDPKKFLEKERLRSEERRKTSVWKEWRKDYEKRNRKNISERARKYYETNEKAREKARIWQTENRKKLTKCIRDHHKRNPFKHAARVFVGAAIKEGILIRPLQCEKCMKICKPEGHHDDYTKPLNVRWLCRSCHGYEHRKMK